ncbi:MAG: protein kinase [Proteobacteria bacterium]|nr:protein kinase [Pseudomonadota bacterium]
MKVDTLRTKLPLLANSLDQRWKQWIDAGGRDDVADFLAHLVERGVVAEDQARGAITNMEVAFTLSEANAVPQGPRYHKFGLLGRGAMGEVHLAWDRSLGRNVAVKSLDPSLVSEPALASRFHQEAQITAQLDHPGIVPIYAIETRQDGTPAYSMKLVRGQELADGIKAARAAWDAGVTEPEDLELTGRLVTFLSVCAAMSYAHERGVLHRDLKPANIMLGAHHEVLVMDWGIAKVVGTNEDILPESAGSRAMQTQVGTILGTPNYMSPEQAAGDNQALTVKSDQYALGLILQELVTLNRAITAKNAVHAVMRAQAASRDEMVHYAGQPVARELIAIVGKACSGNPDDRYSDVEALADDVRRYLRDEPVEAAPDTTGQKLQRWVGRHRQLAISLGVGLFGLVFAVSLLGVLGTTLAVQAGQVRTMKREEALADAIMQVTEQAGRIDREMSRYEALVTGIAFAAEEELARDPDPNAEVYNSSNFLAPDRTHSAFYDSEISVTYPDINASPTTPAETIERESKQLAMVGPALTQALLLSKGFAASALPIEERRALIGAGGVPAVWTYVGTEHGMVAGMPGISEYDEGYDPRERPWYKAGRAAEGTSWTALDLDEGGMGLLLSCVLAIHNHAGEIAGVAALDLSFNYVVEEMLAIDQYPEAEVFLVNREGFVVASSDMGATARTMASYKPEMMEYPEVLERIEQPSGHLDVDSDLFLWRRLQTVDWAYVVRVPAERVSRHE